MRSLRLHVGRTLLSTLGIVLGVASILAIGITNQAALKSVTQLFQDTSGRANLSVISAESNSQGLPQSLLARLITYPGVQVAVPSLQGQAVLANQSTSTSLGLNFFGASVQGGLNLIGIDPNIDKSLRQYQLVEGHFLSGQADELLLVADFAADKKIHLGDRLELLTINGPWHLKVVGLIAKQGAGQINNGGVGFISLPTAQKFFDRPGKVDRIDIIAQPNLVNPKALEELKQGLSGRLSSHYLVIYPASQGARMTQMLSSYQIGLNFMSVMALFIGIFLIYNTFSMRVVERAREFGMFRTIGMTRPQVTWLVLGEAILLGLAGSALGICLGLLMSMGLARLMSMLIGQPLAIRQIPLSALLSSVVVGLLATMIASLLPAWQAGRISPLEALRVKGNPREGWIMRYGWWLGLPLFIISTLLLVVNPFSYDVQYRLGSLAVFGLFLGGALTLPGTIGFWNRFLRPLFRRLYGSSGWIGSSNVERARMRTALTVAALMIGVALMIIVEGMTASFKADLVEWINAYIGGDLYVGSSLPLRAAFWKQLAALPGVAAATPIRYVDIQARPSSGDPISLTFMAIDPVPYSQVTHFVFSDAQADENGILQQLVQGNAILVSSVLAERYQLKTGDTLKLRTVSGWQDFAIIGVVVDFYNQGLTVTGAWDDMRRYFKVNDASTILVKVAPGTPVSQVQTAIQDQYGKRHQLTLIANQTIKQQVNTLLGQAFSMFNMLAVIAILVASLSVINTLSMNVMERTKEIGMLRSVGMTRTQVALMILAEAGLIGVVGGLFGMLFGYLLTRILLSAMMTMSGYRLPFILPLTSIVASLILSLVISQLAALIPGMRAARVRVLEAIHYE
jgi:putative ABC transport system permease protein